MTDAEAGEEATLFPKTAGERLREAREAQGLSLAEVAARTRVPVRHLEAIERGDYSGLPSATYSVGFAKTYARAVGIDEVSIGREVRGQPDTGRRTSEYQPYEMADPKREPPKGLALIGGVIAAVLVLGGAVFYGSGLFGGEESFVAATPTVVEAPPTPATEPTPIAEPVGGQVTLTATDVVWMRVYGATGKALFERELQPGETYDVPIDADRPMINVGRPDKLTVQVNGSTVPPLGNGERAIKDMPISATALLARGQVNPASGLANPASASAASPPATGTTTADVSLPRVAEPQARSSRRSRSNGSSERVRRPAGLTDSEETARANAAAAAAPPPAPTPTPAPQP